MRHRTLLAVVASFALLSVALGASACGSDSGAKPESGVIAGISFIDKAGLHAIDESLNTDGTVPATARTVALQSAAVIRNTEWPSDEKSKAKALADTLTSLAAELDKEPVDIKAAGVLAHDAHEGAHEFSADIWNSLYKKAGLPVEAAHDD